VDIAVQQEMFIPENEGHRIRIHSQMLKDKIQLVEKILDRNSCKIWQLPTLFLPVQLLCLLTD
jgi:hypothetical protein